MTRRSFLPVVIVIVFIFQLWNCAWSEQQETIFTYRAAESKDDLRYQYDNQLLKLALENTVDTDGPYKLVPSPVMNYSRAKGYLKSNSFPNFFLKLSYEPGYKEQGLDYVPFPIDLGIVGYRVCFASSKVADQLPDVQSLEELRLLSHGQGIGWSDGKVLRYNGFEVKEIPRYESLFMMVASNRFDLFCRGANEILDEINMNRHIKDLSYDRSFALFYPLPRFFYTCAANRKALDRVQRGIQIAYHDGTLEKLWRKEYGESVDFAGLQERRIFYLENPLVKDLDSSYQRYFYNPFLME